MPFLDHLEELRFRLLYSLIAVVVCVGVGIWAVSALDLIVLLAAPIAPYLPDGKLTILGVTDQFMIVIKLGFIIGLVLASPFLIYQVWAFMSPALYERERKLLFPALVVGLGLFSAGVWAAWTFVVPFSLKIMLTFQNDAFNTMITYEKYFGFVVQILLALGLCFELPLIMILLSLIGIMNVQKYNTFRRYAVVLAFVAGAVLSPGADVISMILFTIPLLLLYEIGVAGSLLVQRRRIRGAGAIGAIVLLALVARPVPGMAQDPVRPPGSVLDRPDTARQRPAGQGVRALDSASAKRLGLPSGPSRIFPSPDSVMQALLSRRGFAVTRFLGDTAILFAADQRIILGGRAATVRDGATLEADQIVYDDARCEMAARGEPKLFEGARVLIGRAIRFDTCSDRGVIDTALTTFQELGANWFVRGNLAIDSTGKRLYAGNSEFTSCDLPIPHYRFEAGEVKWVSQSALVARPAVLYIRDVPIVWLPFLFQDTKTGRRSGILIPQFGFNDIVRFDRGYRRQVTNIGYYWAPNDFIDVTARLDWYSQRYVRYGAQLQYNWLNRFVEGGLAVDQERQSEGGAGTNFSWRHSQKFNVSTSLSLDASYSSNTRVRQSNAVDPLLTTRDITSSLSFNKRFAWGTLTLGGNRRQSVTDGSGTMLLPSLAITPREIAFGQHVTWSPSLSVLNDLQFKTRLPTLNIIEGGVRDTLTITGSSRRSTFNLQTPLRVKGFSWQNTVMASDEQVTGRRVVSQRVPDTATPAPDDSMTITTVRGGSFQSALDWNTGVNLPQLFDQTWKLTPSVRIVNITSGGFMIRNAATNGDWVRQGKRFEFGVTAAPQFFGFIGGVGPVARIRHKLSPGATFSYSPAASISEEFARALAGSGPAVGSLERPPAMTASIGLNQTIEAKLKPPAGDTTYDDAKRKRTILSLSTSPLSYDFEQAKEPGRTGWMTSAITNSMQSDLLRGFQLSLTHDLWEGQVGTDTAKFSPFLSNVQANFSLTGSTFRSIGALFGLGSRDDVRAASDSGAPPTSMLGGTPGRFRPGSFANSNASTVPGGGSFTASVNFSLQRQRVLGQSVLPVLTDPTTPGGGFGGIPDDPFGGLPIPPIGVPGTRSSLGLNTSFSPTALWKVSWQTQYNVTEGRFESHQLQLQRDLHDWRAQFNFVRSANGNFALFFSVYLMNLPDIKFDYNQTTLQP